MKRSFFNIRPKILDAEFVVDSRERQYERMVFFQNCTPHWAHCIMYIEGLMGGCVQYHTNP